MSLIPKREYLKTGQLFHWAKREHFVLWFTGEVKRHSRTEKLLPRLVNEKKLVARPYGQGLVYSVLRRVRKSYATSDPNIEHGLGCTESLVRAYLSKNGMVVAEKDFRRFKCVPEWGIVYPNKKMLVCEFSTYDNWYQRGNITGKIERYLVNMGTFEEYYGCDIAVLFIGDISRQSIRNFVEKVKPVPFWFCDYETFLTIPYGQQLSASIYIRGDDGQDDRLEVS